MSSFSIGNIVNSTFINVISVYLNNITVFLTETVLTVQPQIIDNLPELLYFDEFQWLLFKVFSLLLIINLLLICVAWKYYGKNICERFMKPATYKAIEELKASVSRLKLPKEYTPRI